MSAAIQYGSYPTGKSKFERLSVQAIEAMQQAEQAWVEGDHAAARRQLAAVDGHIKQLLKLAGKGGG